MRVIVLAFTLLGQSLLAYALLPDGRGAYAVCVLVGSLAGVVMTPGADRGSQYVVMAGQTSVSQGISAALTICVLGSMAAVALLIPWIHSEFSFFQKASTRSFYLALALSPFICLSSVVRLQLAGFRRFVRLAMLSSAQAVMNVLMIVALVWWLELGVNGAVISLVAGHAFVIFVGLADLRRHCQLTLEMPSPNAFKRILGYGLREHVAKVTHAMDARIGSLLLGLVAGRSDIGLFAAGSALMSRMVVIPDAVSMSLLPRVARGGDGRAELTAFCARVCWWLTAAIFAAWVVVSTPVTRILLSEAFLPAVPLTWIMGLGFVVYSGADVFMAFFRGINRPGVCSWAMWLGLCANVVSFFALHPTLGLEGMAWAVAIGLICRSVYLVWMFRRTSGVVLSSVLLPRRGDVSYVRDAGRSIVGRMRGFPNESP